MLSLIIPAKELNDHLFKIICNYKLNTRHDYEIIIVYDKQSDECYDKFASHFNIDDSIILLMNPLKGRINALNYGYSYSKGGIIKCIDSDDILLQNYFDNLSIMDKYTAHCHNATLIDNNDEIIGYYTFEKNILFRNYNYVLSNLKSPPRWIWSFKREIADIIFPIPPELFAEDIWFSLIIKKNCNNIYHMNNSAYLYRQHSGGEWGGIKNFSSEVMSRRAKWNLTVISVLLENKVKLGIVSDEIFYNVINYYKVLLSNKKLSKILCAKTTYYYKLKLFIILYLPAISSMLLSFKWFISKQLIAIKNI